MVRVLHMTLVVLLALAGGAQAADADPAIDAVPAVTGPPPVEVADRQALVALALTLPRHGALVPRLPAPDASDELWIKFAKRLVDIFAPSLARDAKSKLLAETRPLAPAIDLLVPRHRRYLALQARLLAYASATAIQVALPDTPYKVRAGSTAPEVGLLRDRLLAEGYGDDNVADTLRNYFDDRLKRALQAWEKDHGLPATSVLDVLTKKRLNEPLVLPVAEVALALQRWRALDLRRDVGPQIFIDMTRYTLVAERDGVAELTMPIVVGKATEKDATPARTAPLESIIINPSWAVPGRIVEESLKPSASGVPELLIDKGYDVTVDENGRWRVRMPPGPDNPLGKLKFQLSGTNGIYLHDTPARHVFGKADRTLSHGCIRLSQPEALARWLMPDRPYDLTNAIALPTLTQSFALPTAVPVHFVYQTIDAGDAGDAASRLIRRPDIYARDAEALANIDGPAIAAALRAAPPQAP